MGIRNIVMAFLLAAALGAQDRTGTIRGTVTDDTGARVGGAVITAIHAATGQSSSAVSQSDGTYLLLNRELGSYTVTAAKDGFQTGRQEDVVLEIDRTAIVDIQLRVGNRQDSIVVRGDARQIETMPSALTQLVDSRTIQQLPLNGRDYIQLANLQAGAPVARAQTHNVNQGYGIQVSISGSRPYQNSFRLDGLDVSYNGSSPASTNGVTMGVDAVGEFSVLSSGYGAQYGQSAGGIINAVTKSGSNQWRGTAFFFHRNDNLDARNFFDVERPEFRRHQFGASLGGPVIRNQSFFFVNYEGLRQARGNTTIDTTISPNARLGRLVDGAVNVDPKVAQVLDFFPLPNGEILGDTGLFIFANETVSDQNFVTTRFDQNLTAASRLFFRYSYDSGRRSEETDFRAGSSSNSSRNQSGVLELTQALSPSLVHTGRAGFTRFRILENQTAAERPGLDNPALEFAPGAGTVGTIFVTGLTTFPGGTGSVASDNNVNRSLQLSDDLTYARGRHIISAGARLERSFLDTDSRSRQNGDYRFPTIRRFLTNTPDRFRATFPGSDTVRDFGQWLHAIYVHDTWRLLPRLTLDAGVRGEAASIPRESQGKVSNLLHLTDPEMTPGNPLFHKRSFYFTPRAGLAWDVLGNGSTLVRAGYGIYFDFIRPIYIVFLGIRNPPFYTRGETRALSAGDFPNLGYTRLLASPTVDTSVYRVSPEVNQPYVQQWNLNIEQALNRTSSFRVAYVGSHGLNLSSLSNDVNVAAPQTLPDGRLFIPPGSPVANSKFNSVANRQFDAHSFYHGLQTSFRQNLVRGLQFQLTYTYSKSIDDSSNYFTGNEAENSANLPFLVGSKFNRGLSGHDIRHYFTESGIWQLPGQRLRGWGGVWSGWQLGVIVTAASGLPTSVLLGYDAAGTNVHATTPSSIGQRPDAVAGFGNPVTGRPEQWVDPRAFARPQPGYLGNLGRNTITGPNLINFDFSAVKRFPVPQLGGGDASLDLRLEFFNLFNRTNFDLPDRERMGLFSASSTLEDFSRITSARPGREIQLGLKLHF